jgi:hypothetical protein
MASYYVKTAWIFCVIFCLPIQDWGNRLLGPMAFLMPLGVVLSTFGAGNGSLFTAGRLIHISVHLIIDQ